KRTMSSSGAPKLMGSALSDSGLQGEVNPFVSEDDHQLPIAVCSGGEERVGEQLDVVERRDREGQRAGSEDECLDAECLPLVALGAHLGDGSHKAAFPPFVERPVDDACGHDVAHARETAPEAGATPAG